MWCRTVGPANPNCNFLSLLILTVGPVVLPHIAFCPVPKTVRLNKICTWGRLLFTFENNSSDFYY